MSRILIAEDDPMVASFLRRGLRANGMTSHVVDDGVDAQRLGLSGEFDLLLLDIGLPGREGFAVLQELRARGSRLPVLVLTGRPQARDVVACLRGGADDYMTKPFRFDELVARLRARLRDAGSSEAHPLTAGAVHVDVFAHRVTVDGRPVDLTPREFVLLETLVRHAGQVLSREQLLSRAWGYDCNPTTSLVTVHISALRRKVGRGVIETVRGFGYRLSSREPAETAAAGQ